MENKKFLCELKSDIGGAVITALILNKSDPNIFVAKESNEYRGVINFTLSDSKHQIVNCKCWGSKEKIYEYQSQLKLGDVVDVIGAKMQMLSATFNAVATATGAPAQERYVPQPTLAFALIVNEGQGYLEKHDPTDAEVWHKLQNLMLMPHKPPGDALNLADVRSRLNEKKFLPKYVNLFVVVASLRPVKHLRSTRVAGQMLHCLEMSVIDKSLPEGMMLAIWQSDWIARARETWIPRKTVLHLIDVRVSYSDFYKCATLSHAACTYIYVNPRVAETDALLAALPKLLTMNNDPFDEQLPPAEEIQTPTSVQQIYRRAEGDLFDENVGQFTALLYAMLTKFDIDGQTWVISKRCKSCQSLIAHHRDLCYNEQCQLEFSINAVGPQYEHIFNINVHFTDHTGTLTEARLSNTVAERILGMPVSSYMRMSLQQKANLKWLFLMNHFAVKLLIKKSGSTRRQLTAIVIDMQRVDLNELAAKIMIS